jgi:hypothetical protein
MAMNMIRFENGVFNLDTMNFQESQLSVSDNTKSTGYAYKEFQKDDQVIKEIEHFFEQIQPNETSRRELLNYITSCLTGAKYDYDLTIITGSGNNGKSALLNLIKLSFGSYQQPVPVKFLSNMNYTNVMSSPINLEGTRFVHSSEPCKDELINIETIKKLTDYYKCNMTIYSNDDEWIKSVSDNYNMKTFTLPTKFKNNPDPTKSDEFKSDPTLFDKMYKWKEGFMWYLLNVMKQTN